MIFHAPTMYRKLLLQSSALVGCVGGGVCLGIYFERRKLSEYFDYPQLPGLPLCGTVSAASPLTIEEKSGVPVPPPTPNDGKVAPNRVGQIMKYGFPSLANIRSYDDYVLSYDQRNRVAHWVFEHLTKETLKKNETIDRSKCEFREDPSIHHFFRSTNMDYKRSGYDRGHLAAAGNHRLHQKHVEQTFLLSNMAPQVGPGFNRDSWNRLEKYVRKLTDSYANVYVCTGPLYLPRRESDGKLYISYQVIGPNNVAVPTHFFKVVVMESKDRRLEMEAYLMPNKAIENDTPLHVFQVPPESIERAAGLLFFDRISRDKLEKINGKKTTYI
nr:PREDICTED: endonuclease G, mitochondrial [Bemisia tabaci]